MKKESLSLRSITGAEPNEKWMNLGFYTAIAGVLSLLGINLGDFQVGTDHAKYAPWLIILLGGACMYYGTELKKNRVIFDKMHELEIADKRASGRKKKEPTHGNVEFLDWFQKQELPITARDLVKLSFNYDAKRTKTDLLSALISARVEWWTAHGEIKKYGDTYEMRET